MIRENRLENGLSQEQLAFACNLHKNYISFLERGLRQPTLTTIFALAKALRTKPETLIAATRR
ncbi:MAG: helix-turn-helix transcriptional regulator [Gammaproteobacteria bacterium]